VRITGPGLGLVAFSDEDLAPVDPNWLCLKGDRAVDTGRALSTIENELYKLAAKATGLLPPFPVP
jgi:hypothetical protein